MMAMVDHGEWMATMILKLGYDHHSGHGPFRKGQPLKYVTFNPQPIFQIKNWRDWLWIFF